MLWMELLMQLDELLQVRPAGHGGRPNASYGRAGDPWISMLGRNESALRKFSAALRIYGAPAPPRRRRGSRPDY